MRLNYELLNYQLHLTVECAMSHNGPKREYQIAIEWTARDIFSGFEPRFFITTIYWMWLCRLYRTFRIRCKCFIASLYHAWPSGDSRVGHFLIRGWWLRLSSLGISHSWSHTSKFGAITRGESSLLLFSKTSYVTTTHGLSPCWRQNGFQADCIRGNGSCLMR